MSGASAKWGLAEIGGADVACPVSCQLEGGSPPRSRPSLPTDDAPGLATTPLTPPSHPTPLHRSTTSTTSTTPRTPSSLGRTEGMGGGIKRLPSTSAWVSGGPFFGVQQP